MRIAAIGYEGDVLKSIETATVSIDYFQSSGDVSSFDEYAAIFIDKLELLTAEFLATKKPLLVNSVISPLENTLPFCFRVNHWPSFVENSEWEIVGEPTAALDDLFAAMNKKYLVVKNEIGLIAPRILAMIINEAHYAIEDKVSSSAEIDIAMKLGTGYPQGPLEWGQQIGLKHIYDLLLELCKTNERYTPSKLITQLALNK